MIEKDFISNLTLNCYLNLSQPISTFIAKPLIMSAVVVDTSAASFFAWMGCASALVFANLGAAYGTARSGVGLCSMGVMSPGLVMKNIIPIVMAGILGIYGLIVAVIIQGSGKNFLLVAFTENTRHIVLCQTCNVGCFNFFLTVLPSLPLFFPFFFCWISLFFYFFVIFSLLHSTIYSRNIQK